MEKLVNFPSRKMKTQALDRGLLTLEPVGVTTKHPTIRLPLSKLGLGTYLRIFKFSLSPWSNNQLFFSSKISFDSVLDFNYLCLALANLIPHLVYCKNLLPVLSTSNFSLSSSESFDDCPLPSCHV